jgi:UDP:flavonoid glycosyltransferase YjiC (YdhE family)
MAPMLVVARGLPSVVYPALELARRLSARGHRVAFAGGHEAQANAERLDLRFLQLPPSDLQAFAEGDRGGWVDRLRRLTERRDAAVDALNLRAWLDLLHRERPRLVLLNGEMHEEILATMAAGVPLALLNTFVATWRQPSLPPPHHLIVPGAGIKGRRAVAPVLWALLDWRKRVRRLTARVTEAGCDRVSVLGHAARRFGVDLQSVADVRQWLIPFTYRDVPVLHLHAREFEFVTDIPTNVHVVGPMVLADRNAAADPALDAILDRRRRDPQRRLVLAAFGSTLSADVAFLRRLAGIVETRPGWELVLTLSNRLSADALGSLPDRVHVFNWVPQLRVLDHADVMVTHGGINSIDECVLNGVPALVYCGFQTDMGGATARLVYHGLGLGGDPRDSTADIRARVDRLLQEPSFHMNLERFGRAYRAYREGQVAERAVEHLLASLPPPAWREAAS